MMTIRNKAAPEAAGIRPEAFVSILSRRIETMTDYPVLGLLTIMLPCLLLGIFAMFAMWFEDL